MGCRSQTLEKRRRLMGDSIQGLCPLVAVTEFCHDLHFWPDSGFELLCVFITQRFLFCLCPCG